MHHYGLIVRNKNWQVSLSTNYLIRRFYRRRGEWDPRKPRFQIFCEEVVGLQAGGFGLKSLVKMRG